MTSYNLKILALTSILSLSISAQETTEIELPTISERVSILLESEVSEEELRPALADLFKQNQIRHYYKTARLFLFDKVYTVTNEESGQKNLKELYCGKEYESGIEITFSESQLPDGTIVNTEHSWPKSRFFKYEDNTPKSKHDFKEMLSDLHHLFPTDSFANSTRASYHYGEVDKNTEITNCESSKFGKNQRWETLPLFEPPNDVKGDIARALFYFSIRYELPIDDREEFFLRKWHLQDPVSEFEKRRNTLIEEFQGNRNYFIDHPEMSSMITNF